MAEQAGTAATTFAAVREVRFAVVLFGGVSLAIYMSGITEELLHLVRATAPKEPGSDDVHVADGDLSHVEKVYRDLGRQLCDGRLGDDTGAVQTRFVVDILTGTSAGGINGVFLAKALVNDCSLTRLRQLWVEEGDIGKLINDRVAYRDIGLAGEKPPKSLLSGPRMYHRLLDAFSRLDQPQPPPAVSPYAAELDLWVTATDLRGWTEKVNTTDGPGTDVVVETNHRAQFHFAYAADAEGASGINQFTTAYDPMLAFAARCTSSFPGAFAPMRLGDAVPAIDKLEKPRSDPGQTWFDLDSNTVARFFQTTVDETLPQPRPAPYLDYSFADGGYLDNRPIDLVMRSLPKRRADIPVERLVLFADPDPSSAVVTGRGEPVDLAETLLKVVTLPRVETIGADVDRILDFAALGAARRQAYQAIDRTVDDLIGTGEAGPSPDASPPSPAEVAREAIHLVRANRAIEEVAETIARIVDPAQVHEPGSAVHRLLIDLVTQALLGAAPGRAQVTAVLAGFDATAVLRHIDFVKGRIGDLMRRSRQPTFGALAHVRTVLDTQYRQLRARLRELRDPAADPPTREALAELLDRMPDPAAPRPDIDAEPELRTALQRVLDVCENHAALAAAVDSTREALTDALEGAEALRDADKRSIDEWWDHFDVYYDATYTLQEQLPGENDRIAVMRISPREATAIRADEPDRHKLAGAGIHHFGAFFSADWRRNDILWGRLDGAERLIHAVVRADSEAEEAARDAFVKRAHLAIVREALDDDDFGNMLRTRIAAEPEADDEAERVIRWLRSDRFRLPPAPPRPEVVRLGLRAARVVRRVGDGVADEHPQLANPLAWLGRSLSYLAGFAELALPGSLRSLFGRQAMKLVCIAGVLLVLAGAVAGTEGVTTVGWAAIALSTLGMVGVDVIGSWLDASKRWLFWLGVVVLVAGGLVVYGALDLSQGWQQSVGFAGIGLAFGLIAATSAMTAVLQPFRWLRGLAGKALRSLGLRRRAEGAAAPAAPMARDTPTAVQRVGALVGVLILVPLAVMGGSHLRSDICDGLDDWHHFFRDAAVCASQED